MVVLVLKISIMSPIPVLNSKCHSGVNWFTSYQLQPEIVSLEVYKQKQKNWERKGMESCLFKEEKGKENIERYNEKKGDVTYSVSNNLRIQT